MKRAEALEKFTAESREGREAAEQAFRDNLAGRAEELMGLIYAAFEEIGHQAQEKGKECLTFFLFSLQRVDLLEGRALYRLDAMGPEWYFDQEPLYTCIDLTFLFRPLFGWKEKLLSAIRPYRGKVNRYDAEYLIQNEAMAWNRLAAGMLRLALRKLETNQAFASIPKVPIWAVHWGEYRDYSEIVCQVYREVRGQKEWEEKLTECRERTPGQPPGYWYGGSFTDSDCRNIHMEHTVFEACSLAGIDFEGALLTGARFLGCRIENCSFKQAVLGLAEFRECAFINTCFEDASLEMAIFTQDGFMAKLFDERQLAELLVEKTARKQAGQEEAGE